MAPFWGLGKEAVCAPCKFEVVGVVHLDLCHGLAKSACSIRPRGDPGRLDKPGMSNGSVAGCAALQSDEERFPLLGMITEKRRCYLSLIEVWGLKSDVYELSWGGLGQAHEIRKAAAVLFRVEAAFFPTLTARCV